MAILPRPGFPPSCLNSPNPSIRDCTRARVLAQGICSTRSAPAATKPQPRGPLPVAATPSDRTISGGLPNHGPSAVRDGAALVPDLLLRPEILPVARCFTSDMAVYPSAPSVIAGPPGVSLSWAQGKAVVNHAAANGCNALLDRVLRESVGELALAQGAGSSTAGRTTPI